MLNGTVQDLSDVAVFGSTCTVHRDARNKSLGERRNTGVIIGKSDKASGTSCGDSARQKRGTVTKEQNAHLRRVHLADVEDLKKMAAKKSSGKHPGAVSDKKLKDADIKSVGV